MTAEDRIRAAIDRLIAGQATHPAASLTVAGLAREAGAGRATVNRYPALRAEFQQKAAALGGAERATARDAELDRLRRELRDLKAERWEELTSLRHTVAVYANRIQVLEVKTRNSGPPTAGRPTWVGGCGAGRPWGRVVSYRFG